MTTRRNASKSPKPTAFTSAGASFGFGIHRAAVSEVAWIFTVGNRDTNNNQGK
jgi:hypothetical protein